MSRITEITVSSGRVLPHPYVSYANLRPMVTLKAIVEEGGEPLRVSDATTLQLECETLLDQHVALIMANIEKARQDRLDALERERQERLEARKARMGAQDQATIDEEAAEDDLDEDDEDDLEDDERPY
jgi:hypothetical protein